jgi:hypothetical protein
VSIVRKVALLGDKRHDLNEIACEGSMHIGSPKGAGWLTCVARQRWIGRGSTEEAEATIAFLPLRYIPDDMADVMDVSNFIVHDDPSLLRERSCSPFIAHSFVFRVSKSTV